MQSIKHEKLSKKLLNKNYSFKQCNRLKQYFYFERRFNKKVCEEKNSITFVKNVYWFFLCNLCYIVLYIFKTSMHKQVFCLWKKQIAFKKMLLLLQFFSLPSEKSWLKTKKTFWNSLDIFFLDVKSCIAGIICQRESSPSPKTVSFDIWDALKHGNGIRP